MTESKRIVLATRNADKVKEITGIIQNPEYDLVSLLDFEHIPDIVESGDTLKENAFIKARTAFQYTGLPCMADDTGLEVDALNGAPGVRSSRFAGESCEYRENNEKLLKLMQNVPDGKRTARFRCVVALVHDGGEHWTEGICEGKIMIAYRGQGGFGYDPLFFIPRLGKTFAELELNVKNQISHRGQAFRNMAEYIQREKIV